MSTAAFAPDSGWGHQGWFPWVVRGRGNPRILEHRQIAENQAAPFIFAPRRRFLALRGLALWGLALWGLGGLRAEISGQIALR